MVHQCCEKSEYKMTTIQSVIARSTIVLGMVAATMTVLYFTPIPDHTFANCDRPCHDLDWPMICRIKLYIEEPQKFDGICEDCSDNSTACNKDYCLIDDTSRRIIVANRQLPGPPIEVCQNDIVIVDVVNKVSGHSLTIHWRGQPNDEAPFMDGVPMVTQCPVPSFTTFQYKFRASVPGTHFYHAYSDSDRSDGLFGAMIVRQPEKLVTHRKLYDVDDKENVVLISEWADKNLEPNSLLINGKAPSRTGPVLSVFNVIKGKRYRFRLAYTSGYSGCPVTVALDKHLMKIIALDGNPIQPYEAGSVILSKGERLDFVLKANQEPKHYNLRVKSECNGNLLDGLAIINYEGTAAYDETYDNEKMDKVRNFDTAMCESKIGKVCLNDVKAMVKMPQKLRQREVDKVLYLAYGSKVNVEGNIRSTIFSINNLTFTYPSSPLLTQLNEVPIDSTCDMLNVPQNCVDKNMCRCVHVENIPLGASTEIILVDQGAGDDEEHVFHLHGNHFYVVASTTFKRPMSLNKTKSLDLDDELFKRNLNNPVLKDTVRIPKNGAVALRFIANNPGFWMLRDEKSKGWTRGMDVVLQVGDIGDVPSTPSKFPICGSYIGPDFMLI